MMHRLFIAYLVLFGFNLATYAQPATIDRISCGNRCITKISQLSPVSKTRGGYPRVLVGHKTIQVPVPAPYSLPGEKLIGFDRAGDPIVKIGGETYPKSEIFWVVADCQNGRIGLHGKHSDGLDAQWGAVLTESGEPISFLDKYNQWRLLCTAARGK